mmetsp:Transcript_13456/g.20770  ORF Transcript_13456/g.20770 Transcript_13456/m.20770 type:complete len:110 (+) Transcript_13456:236-565(+)
MLVLLMTNQCERGHQEPIWTSHFPKIILFAFKSQVVEGGHKSRQCIRLWLIQSRRINPKDEGRRVTLQGKQEKGGEGEKGRGMIFTKKKEPLCDSFLDHHNDSKMSPLS